MPLPFIPLLLTALKFAPSVFSAGKSVVEAVTGTPPPPDRSNTPEALAEFVGSLPPDQQAEITGQVLEHKTRLQQLDSQRFALLTDGDTEKVRATARPEIARRAMGVIEVFAIVFKWLGIATLGEWVLRLVCDLAGWQAPAASLWGMVAEAAPVAEMIWAPLLASFWVSAEIVKKYFGCRERDKARQDELTAGRPLDATAATIQAAGGGVASIIRAVRGGR